jgi:hypothetical protein
VFYLFHTATCPLRTDWLAMRAAVAAQTPDSAGAVGFFVRLRRPFPASIRSRYNELHSGEPYMSAMTVELNGEIVEELRRLAAAQERSETEIVREALSAYLRGVRPLPKGMGRYRSGQGNVSEQARDLLRQAVKDNQWP